MTETGGKEGRKWCDVDLFSDQRYDVISGIGLRQEMRS